MQRFLFVMAFGLAVPVCGYAADLPATSHVKAVTVYSDRASVTRSAVIDLPAGANTVVFSGLPQSLMADSLRSAGESAGDVVLGAIESKIVSSAELAAPRERELTEKMQALQDQRAVLQADQQALEQKLAFLTSLSEQASLRERENIAAIDLKPEQWQNAANTLSSALADTGKAQAGLAVQLRGLDQQIAALQSDLAQLRTGARASYVVRVPVEAKAATRLTIDVSYQVPEASWSPVYDARLETASGKLALTQYGEVRQQTGEDWGDVRLILSTAQPARGTGLPTFDPLWVSLYAPPPPMAAYRMANESALAGMADSVAAAPAPAQEMAVMSQAPVMKQVSFVAAQMNAQGYVTEYTIAGPSTVLADGTTRKVMVGSLEVSSELMVSVKPELDSQAYLIARTKLGGESPLLPGQASLFRDGAFIGTAALDMLRPGQQTDLGFGVDDQVTVKHQVVKDESGESGVISRDNTRTRQTATEVQNLHRQPVKLVMLQRIPASQNEQVRLELDRTFTTKGFEENVDKVTGQLGWTQSLAPQQKTSIQLGWTLSWPKDSNLSGLPY